MPSDLQILMSRAVRSGNVRRYHTARAKLIADLGGKCVDCDATDNLQFGHIIPRTWRACHTSRWVRIARYRREAMQGLVVLLCPKCNNAQGNARRSHGRRLSRED